MTRYIDLVNDVFARDRLNRYSSFCWLLSVRRLFSKGGKIFQGKGVKAFKTPEKKVFSSLKKTPKPYFFGPTKAVRGNGKEPLAPLRMFMCWLKNNVQSNILSSKFSYIWSIFYFPTNQWHNQKFVLGAVGHF
jgi:hypothetical protein